MSLPSVHRCYLAMVMVEPTLLKWKLSLQFSLPQTVLKKHCSVHAYDVAWCFPLYSQGRCKGPKTVGGCRTVTDGISWFWALTVHVYCCISTHLVELRIWNFSWSYVSFLASKHSTSRCWGVWEKHNCKADEVSTCFNRFVHTQKKIRN